MMRIDSELAAGNFLASGAPDALLHNDEWRLMFHGTASPAWSFGARAPVEGDDCNSALGLSVAEWPALAADYADTDADRIPGAAPVVLALLVPAKLPVVLEYNEFFGYDEDGSQVRDHDGFFQLRRQLAAKGHDIVDFEDSDGPYSIALAPEQVAVIAHLTLDQAADLNSRMLELADAYSGEDRLSLVRDLDGSSARNASDSMNGLGGRRTAGPWAILVATVAGSPFLTARRPIRNHARIRLPGR